MDIRKAREIVARTARWIERTDLEVKKAGGSGVGAILDDMPEELLYSLVANDLYIMHMRKTDDRD